MLTRGREQTDVCFHESLGGRQTLVFKGAHLDAKTVHRNYRTEEQTDAYVHESEGDGPSCVHEN